MFVEEAGMAEQQQQQQDSPIATAVGFKANFRREMKKTEVVGDVRFSAGKSLRSHFPARHRLSVLLVVLRLKRTQQSFCKQGILMFVKVEHERIQ